jgi:hypothetical protein
MSPDPQSEERMEETDELPAGSDAPSELKQIVEQHRLWLQSNGEEG